MRNTRKIGVALWIVQVLLALFFLSSGVPKLVLPPESLPMPIPLPEPFLLFVGVCETLGAIGLILPGVTRVQTSLTPLAATGLVLVTICATVYNLLGHQPESAIFAVGVGIFAAFVAYGRWRLAPLPSRSGSPSFSRQAQPAA